MPGHASYETQTTHHRARYREILAMVMMVGIRILVVVIAGLLQPKFPYIILVMIFHMLGLCCIVMAI